MFWEIFLKSYYLHRTLMIWNKYISYKQFESLAHFKSFVSTLPFLTMFNGCILKALWALRAVLSTKYIKNKFQWNLEKFHLKFLFFKKNFKVLMKTMKKFNKTLKRFSIIIVIFKLCWLCCRLSKPFANVPCFGWKKRSSCSTLPGNLTELLCTFIRLYLRVIALIFYSSM